MALDGLVLGAAGGQLRSALGELDSRTWQRSGLCSLCTSSWISLKQNERLPIHVQDVGKGKPRRERRRRAREGDAWRTEAEVVDGPHTGFGGRGRDRKGRGDYDDGSEKARTLSDSTIYPVMRTFRNDLCSLEITGDAKAWEVIQAMAADGGFTASEELAKGRKLMTVETIVPGRGDDHSTVSTKLLAPTDLVYKKAKSGRNKSSAYGWGYSSGNALSRAFNNVTMHRVLAFQICVYGPGTVRDMANLTNEEQTGVVARLDSRDGNVLEGLAEAVNSFVLASIKNSYERNGTHGIFRQVPFWNKPRRFWSFNKAIGVGLLHDKEIWENTSTIDCSSSVFKERGRPQQSWWPLSDACSISHLREGSVNVLTEFVPIHELEIDTSQVQVEVEGWRPTIGNNVVSLELTHAQMSSIADMLDLFYEDEFTVPGKQLSSRIEWTVPESSRSKVATAVWRVVASVLAGAILVVGLLGASKIRRTSSANLMPSSAVKTSYRSKWCMPKYNRQVLLPSNNEVSPEEMQELCTQVVFKMKQAFNLKGTVQSSPGKGAWLGPDITDWQTPGEANESISSHGVEGTVADEYSGETMKLPEEVVLRYQVMLSREGKVVGFQPGNKAAVRYWVNYPFAEELHKGRRLGPGLIEGGLRYVEPPKQAVAIELLCRPQSVKPAIAARPLKIERK